MSAMQLAFTLWKAALRQDCERRDKVLAFEAMGEDVLRMFWERGAVPTVQGILEDSSSTEPIRSTGKTVH